MNGYVYPWVVWTFWGLVLCVAAFGAVAVISRRLAR